MKNVLGEDKKIQVTRVVLTCGKLFNMFPWTLSVKTRYAETASVTQETRDINVDTWVTFANLSSVGVRRLP